MKFSDIPVTDDHIHIDPLNGRGMEAVKDFKRSGGTHMFLVTKPSWSYGISPLKSGDFIEVFEAAIRIAKMISEENVTAFPVLGVHPAEITKFIERMPLRDAEAIMCGALSIAADYVNEGQAVALKSGRPHYTVDDDEILNASNRVLMHSIELAAECGCALQIHAESGSCEDVAVMAGAANMPAWKIVKHFAIPNTPLTPSMLAKHEAIPEMANTGRLMTMESDYMDDNSRPGAVIGPRSVPRYTRKMLESGAIDIETAYKLHKTNPEKIYGVDISH